MDDAPIQATDRLILTTASSCIVDDVNIGHFETQYTYDALGRRIEKRTAEGATRYIYDGARVAEEWSLPDGGSPSLAASYVYGLYIDEVLTMRRGGSDYYYHGDDMHNVVKLTDEDGEVVEAYDYGDYGQPEFYDEDGVRLDVTASQFDNPYLFAGREWDAELGYYYFRKRYMDPGLGRFASRDPLGIWGDPLNLGNGYTYAAGNPWSLVDPFGLECKNPGNVSATSSFSDILAFGWNLSPGEDLISEGGADWNGFNGAGSDTLRENDHESKVLRAGKVNEELAEKLARDGAEGVAAEGAGRIVGAGIGAAVEAADDAGWFKGIRKWAKSLFGKGEAAASGQKLLPGPSPSSGTALRDVSKHLFSKGQLPDNFITKSQALNLGWNPRAGNLWDVAPGKSIGGDIYRNQGGLLPTASGRIWFEADLNYSGGFRGTERLVYSNDGLIYYTGDHYKTLQQIGG